MYAIDLKLRMPEQSKKIPLETVLRMESRRFAGYIKYLQRCEELEIKPRFGYLKARP